MRDILCIRCHLPLSLCPYEGEHPDDPMLVASDQAAQALTELRRHADDYVRWPWKRLDEMYGGMAPGTVHYVVGFSGLGKTCFIASAILRWLTVAGRRVDVLPLEVSAANFRLYLACQLMGADPGRILSGDFRADPDAAETRALVEEHVLTLAKGAFVRSLYVHGAERVTAAGLVRAARDAKARGAEILVVDHIDHVSANDTSRSLYQASVEVNNAALDAARETGLVLVLMSQANQEALRGTADRLAKYQPPREHHVLNGGHKRQVATGMLGLFRPVKLPPEGADAAQLAAYKRTMKDARAGHIEPQEALEPKTMGVSLMKSRNYGGREGGRVLLTWQNGRIVERSVLPYSLRAG